MEKKLNQLVAEDKGQELNIIGAIKELDYKPMSTGKLYMAGILQTRDGEIVFRKWKYTQDEKDKLKVGTVVEINSKIDVWNGAVQLNVDQLKVVDLDPEQFVCTIMKPENELKEEMSRLLKEVKSDTIRGIMEEVIDNAGEQFWIHCAAKSMHHAEKRGLAMHTITVMDLCNKACEIYGDKVNKDIVLCSALFHDIGKLKEMNQTALGNGEYAADAILGHIFMGAELAMEYFHKQRWDYETARHVAHCVLAHHGKLENGSPVEPATAEAAILAECDNMDAQVTRILTKSLTMTDGQYSKDKVYKSKSCN